MTDSEKLNFLVEAIAQQSEAMARQEERMDALEKNLKEEIQEVRTELKEEIQGVRSELGEEIQKLQKDVTGIKLVIENELRKNISIVAEGHLDLSRKLDEAIKGNQERETFMIRFNTLETYVKEMRKERTA